MPRPGAAGCGPSSPAYTPPPADSPAFWAFRAFRTFDGKGGHFLDESAAASSSNPLTSIFASRDRAKGQVVAVLLNFDPASPLVAEVALTACGALDRREAYAYAPGSRGLSPLPSPALSGKLLEQELPPYSITVLDLGAPASKP